MYSPQVFAVGERVILYPLKRRRKLDTCKPRVLENAFICNVTIFVFVGTQHLYSIAQHDVPEPGTLAECALANRPERLWQNNVFQSSVIEGVLFDHFQALVQNNRLQRRYLLARALGDHFCGPRKGDRLGFLRHLRDLRHISAEKRLGDDAHKR